MWLTALQQRLLVGFGHLKSKTRQKGHIAFITVAFAGLALMVVVMTTSNTNDEGRINELINTALKKRGIHVPNEDQIRKKRDIGKQKDVEYDKSVNVPGPGGAVYIRWGRSTCPNQSEMVYSGIGGGSHNSHEGSATNFQCLPNKPVWSRYTDGGGIAYMYGMEYKDNMDGLMDMTNVHKNLMHQNVPCVVCRSIMRTSPLMIPAMDTCVEGWHLEYNGYLMAGAYSEKSGSQYICVDRAPEADPAGFRDEGGIILYRVAAACGSLPCPRYVSSRELPCAVCTK